MRIKIRQVVEADHAFIYATYIRNRWFDKANMTTLKRMTWSSLQHKRLENLLEKANVLVACLDEDPDVILGYVFKDEDGPYTYLKQAFRAPELQIRNKLLKELGDK